MSAREWKPGDVALVTYYKRMGPRVALIGYRSGTLTFEYGDGGWDYCHSSPGAAARPLVVIDPEDREQVERLWGTYYTAPQKTTSPIVAMQAALRSLITPPRPEEPTGLGAVVEAGDGHQYVRVDHITAAPWRRDDVTYKPWDSLPPPVTVLHPGWTEGDR